MRKYLWMIPFFFLTIAFGQTTDSKSSSNLLMNAPTISVTIGGDFIITGSFPASVSERVDEFVTQMYNQGKQQLYRNINDPNYIKEVNKKLEDYSLRNIKLKRIDGQIINIDLLKFRVTGDFNYNPYLRNDDVLIFRPSDIKHNFFDISGAVNSPGEFPFVEGDKLSDAILLAQGVNKSYENVNFAEIDRLSYNGEQMKSIKVSLSDDVPLERGDRIIVLANEDEKKNYQVDVIGEVNMPGKVPITKGKSTIKEVIDKCGGFRNDADLYRAELIRGTNAFKSITFSDQVENLRMLRMSTLVNEDSLYFNVDEMLRLMRGNGLIDFEKVAKGDSAASNFIVNDGDVIYIPPKIDLVYLFGQVNTPGYVQYKKAEDYKYYLKQAGGIGQTASGDVYLIKGNSRAWFNLADSKNKIDIEAGDYIWVAKKTPTTFWGEVTKISQLTATITGLATLVFLYYQVKKL